ncbi:GID4/VID24 family protein NDAI_0A05190 [Naumovozyma dairenensis CBS 421]|uniref:Vacuolar import and degradation protein 24 n=1 Tax=Naumovozyma dairenensis (strain ATCC 10597 / BCRC 20456 / CBS 421 / NBRC 0211 / NRRL Y-12639) TaxID=1071378 RepID=G0W4D6_NAUDC|nr:hypothetical protein NDAI_0A05190 [Naumovozyma dairenensis CBS 421]CCD22674.1 hypothetical protein NDAI_0A05190 [Naumovozyma dairenensis CBS 421]
MKNKPKAFEGYNNNNNNSVNNEKERDEVLEKREAEKLQTLISSFHEEEKTYSGHVELPDIKALQISTSQIFGFDENNSEGWASSLFSSSSDDSRKESSYEEIADETNIRNKKSYKDESETEMENSTSLCCLEPQTTMFLKPGMEFVGFQVSGYKKYTIEVNLHNMELPCSKHVSPNPHIYGIITIIGLTGHHQRLSTYFEGFVCGNERFGFLSSSWPQDRDHSDFFNGDESDIAYWSKLKPFEKVFSPQHLWLYTDYDKDLRHSFRKLTKKYCDKELRERYIFMKWKEKFYITDTVEYSINGASYEGFYYIVHDRLMGTIEGYFYEEGGQRFQHLELQPLLKPSSEHFSSSFEFR